MRPRIERPDRIYLILVLVVVFVVVVLAFRDWRAFHTSTEEIAASQRILAANAGYLSAIKDAETGQRGFLITGRDEYLAPFRTSIQQISGHLSELDAAAAQRPGLVPKIQRLKLLTAGKLNELASAVSVRRSDGMAAAIAIVQSDRGRRDMDEIRFLTNFIETAEYARLTAGAKAFEANGTRTRAVFAAATLALLFLLILAFLRIGAATSERDRVIANLDLVNSEARTARDLLEITLTSIGDGVIATDSASRITFLNAAAQRLTGWTFASASGQPLAGVFAPIREKPQPAEPADPRNGNHSLLIARDGTAVPIDESAAPIRNSAGTTVGYVYVFRDVSERVAAERELRKSEERLRLAASSGEVGLWDWDLVSNRIEWSDYVYRLHDLDTGQFDGSPEAVLSSVHPDDRPKMSGRISQTLEHGTPYDFEFRTVHRDGSIHWLSTSARVVRDHEGRAIRMLGAVKEVSLRREAEAALRLAAERFRVGLAQAGVIVYNQDRDLRYTWIYSPGIPHPEQEFIGRTDLEISSEPHADRLTRLKEQVLASGEPIREEYDSLINGQHFTFNEAIEPLRDEQGSIIGITGAAIDVTRIKQNERELLRLNEILRRANSDLQQFSYAASHDLKEPLRTIATYLELLQRRYKSRTLDQGADDLIAYAVKGAGRMAQLLNALLDYSRAGAHGVEQVRDEVDMSVIVEEVRQSLRRSIADKQASVEAGPLPRVRGDAVLFRQLLQNLLSNAIKYHSDRPPVVRVTAEERSSEWEFAVADNGIGIDPRYAATIFGIFKRLHRDEYDGAGIGLATCKRIVENYGGRIWVDSTAGNGSTFRFTLPKA